MSVAALLDVSQGTSRQSLSLSNRLDNETAKRQKLFADKDLA